jgi:hypothetical protein
MHIAKITRVMLNENNLPNYFWVEVVGIAVYIMDWTPTTTIDGMTSEEKFKGNKLYVSHLVVFGCITYMHVLHEKRSKLDLKADKCIFIKYFLD